MKRLPSAEERLARFRAWTERNKNIKNQDLKNLNININKEPSINNNQDLKNLNACAEKIPRLALWTDKVYQKALSWGFDERVLQICVREYGSEIVKWHIDRISRLPDGYFHQTKYGPIAQQRGKCFNFEMQKLRRARA